MKTILLALGAACFVAACVNLHVHFPEAPAPQATPPAAGQSSGAERP